MTTFQIYYIVTAIYTIWWLETQLPGKGDNVVGSIYVALFLGWLIWPLSLIASIMWYRRKKREAGSNHQAALDLVTAEDARRAAVHERAAKADRDRKEARSAAKVERMRARMQDRFDREIGGLIDNEADYH